MASKNGEFKLALPLSPCPTQRLCLPPSSEDREQIEATVADLLDRECTDDERRSEPRIRFIRRGQVRWEKTADAAGAGTPPLPSACPPGCEVVTIDISNQGVGIIAWQQIPKRHIVLELGGVLFLCKLLWEKAIGSQAWQYGLLFDKSLGFAERSPTYAPCND